MTPSTSPRVLVVGSGIAGLSTAWALTRRGFAVEVFEQGQIPNAKASSYDEHRITRHAYGTFDGYARMMPDAFRVYEDLWTDLGARHFEPLPLVVLQREDVPWFDASRASMDELDVAHRDIPLGEVAARYPMIATDGLTGAYEAEGAGVLFPIRILTDLVVHLASRGVRFHAGARVDAVDPETATVSVGPRPPPRRRRWWWRPAPGSTGWCRGSRVSPCRRDRRWLSWRRRRTSPTPGPSAPVFIDLGADSGTYTLPPRPGTRLKVGDHEFTRRGDPDGDRLATDADVERLFRAAALSYRDFDRYTVLERKACFYTVTEDESFIAEAIGARGYVLSACSGHGFKLGALMGEGVARVIAGERSREELPHWAAGRSRSGTA